MTLTQKQNPLITLQEAKAHLYVDHDMDNNLIQGYLQSAIAYCSEYIGIYPYGASYEATPDEIDSGDLKYLELEYRPYYVEVQYASDMEFYNKPDIDQIYTSEIHQLTLYAPEAISIKAEVGLSGLRGQDRLMIFGQAVLLQVGDFYKYRENDQTLSISSLSTGTKRLLDQIQVDV
jgi:hypothetical protein